MSLADAPIATPCLVRTTGTEPVYTKYLAAGIAQGAIARVLARYPERQPRFAEVEIDGARLVTVPLGIAEETAVELLGGADLAHECGCELPCPDCAGGCGCGGVKKAG